MKKFYSFVRENAANVINFEKKKILPPTVEEQKLHQDSTVCYFCRKQKLNKI